MLVTGGRARDFPGDAFWNDTVWMYETLIASGYSPADVWVLFGDGVDHGSPNPRYRPEARVTRYAATPDNVRLVLHGLRDGDGGEGIERLADPDSLLVWIFGHGQSSGLILGNRALRTDDLARMLDALPCARRAVLLAQCYGGALVPRLSDERTYVSAASMKKSYESPHVEVYDGREYWHSEYDYWLLSALNGRTPAGDRVDADTNGDGRVSLAEAHALNVARNEARAREVPVEADPGGVGKAFCLRG